jgi:hypothetical protein
MKVLHDRWNLAIRLTEERLAHIVEHPEMATMEDAIGMTLMDPESVVTSLSDL